VVNVWLRRDAGWRVEAEHRLVVAGVEQLGGAGLCLEAFAIAGPLRLEGAVREIEHRSAEVADAIGARLIAAWSRQRRKVLGVVREDRAPAPQPSDHVDALHPALKPAQPLVPRGAEVGEVEDVAALRGGELPRRRRVRAAGLDPRRELGRIPGRSFEEGASERDCAAEGGGNHGQDEPGLHERLDESHGVSPAQHRPFRGEAHRPNE
jgi:hypothetical protein